MMSRFRWPSVALTLLCTACLPSPSNLQFDVDVPVADEGRAHVEEGTTVTYKANPPASGPHWPTPASPGFYSDPLPPERWVHNLEHGYIVVLFDCRGACDGALSAELAQLLQALSVSPQFGFVKLVVTPYDGLPSGVQICVVAWDVQMYLKAYNFDLIRDFYNRHLEQAPENNP